MTRILALLALIFSLSGCDSQGPESFADAQRGPVAGLAASGDRQAVTKPPVLDGSYVGFDRQSVVYVTLECVPVEDLGRECRGPARIDGDAKTGLVAYALELPSEIRLYVRDQATGRTLLSGTMSPAQPPYVWSYDVQDPSRSILFQRQ